MRPLVPLFLLSLLLTVPALAQLRIDAGLAVGFHSYGNSGDTTRVLPGGDLLLRSRSGLGLHLAGEFTDLADGGSTLILHPNLAYRHEFNDRYSMLAGAGPTFVQSANMGSDRSFNVELELARRIRQVDVFVRARHYDYQLFGFRAATSPGGSPAFYAGLRTKVR